MSQPTDAELEKLYAELRASILARQFALGRYFRANYFSTGNYLGIRTAKSIDCRTPWQKTPKSPPGRRQEGYDSAADLLTLAPALQDKERWRVILHERENPLDYSGAWLCRLAIEYHLGNKDSHQIIQLILQSIGSLYKIKDPEDPFAGYIIRYDECTCDSWTARFENGKEIPVTCCNFFLDPNPDHHGDRKAGAGYLHCSPLDHPTYVEARKKNDGFVARRFRHWEVSMDELVGLVAGYSTVYKYVDDPEVKKTVKDQVTNLAKYLATFSYLLVRPCGGFTARGSSGFLQALEFPFNRVFFRITGIDFSAPFSSTIRPLASDTNFVSACKAARVWPCMETAVDQAGQIGAAAGTVLGTGLTLDAILGVSFASWLMSDQGLGSDDARSVVAAISEYLQGINFVFGPAAGSGLGYVLGRAGAIYLNRRCFDVWDDSQQGEFALAYLLKWLPPDLRFKLWMHIKPSPGRCADNFKYFVGIMALDDDDTTLREQYLQWYDTYEKNLEPEDEVRGQGNNPWTATCVSAALAALLRGDPDDEVKVVKQICRMYERLDQDCKRSLVLSDTDEDKYGTGCADPVKFDYVREDDVKKGGAGLGGYLNSLAIAWLHTDRKDSGLAEGFPRLPNPQGKWNRAMVPASIIAEARNNQVVIPLNQLQRSPLTTVPPEGVDLFLDPPPKPDSPACGQPAPPLNPVEFWVEAEATPPTMPDPSHQPTRCSVSVTVRMAAPSIPSTLRGRYILVASEPIVDPSTIRESVVSIDRRYQPESQPNEVFVTVVVEATAEWNKDITRIISRRRGYFKAKYYLSWVPKQIETCQRA